MKSFSFLLALILTLFLNTNQVLAQTESDSTKDNPAPDFSNMQLLGDEGVVGHELSYQTKSNVEPFLDRLIQDFGETDDITKSNDYIWQGLNIKKWHDEPITLKVHVGKMLNSDGSPMGKNWITISIETPDEKMLLKPDTESHQIIKSYFDKLREETL